MYLAYFGFKSRCIILFVCKNSSSLKICWLKNNIFKSSNRLFVFLCSIIRWSKSPSYMFYKKIFLSSLKTAIYKDIHLLYNIRLQCKFYSSPQNYLCTWLFFHFLSFSKFVFLFRYDLFLCWWQYSVLFLLLHI